MTAMFLGLDPTQLAAAYESGVDHGGNPIEPFIDDEGGWPLRCCLTDSAPGDRIAIIAWSPFPWKGAYAETGPVVIHADGCSGTNGVERLPDDFDARPMTLRPYTHDHVILYSAVTHVPADSGLSARAARLLERDDVAEVVGRNVTGGCFAFRAIRS